MSHRALVFNALSVGRAVVCRANPGADVASTARCLRALGVTIRMGDAAGDFEIEGRGLRWRPAPSRLDCGNSGTTARLLAGVLAGQEFTSILDGDESLRRRPMSRIADPLRAHGARAEGPDNAEHLPMILTGPLRQGGTYVSPVASAQVKSAMLLAALVSGLSLRVEEPWPSRNHTEILLVEMGARLEHGPGWAEIESGSQLCSLDIDIAADPSAAAFLLGASALVKGSQVVAEQVMLNPTRLGFVEVMRRMGIDVHEESRTSAAGEEAADLLVASRSELRPVRVVASEIPSMVDEVPILAVMAACASGVSTFEGIGELRVKESDRVKAITDLLGAWSIDTRVDGDTLEVHGGSPVLSGVPPTFVDHRMAMAEAVLAMAAHSRHPTAPATKVDVAAAVISDPMFGQTLERLQHGA